jgi:hypothetical protein
MLGTLGSLIEFKYITALNLNILGKDNIVCVSLVNANMCLNSIGEPDVFNLRNCT